jgi:hypothetical protein
MGEVGWGFALLPPEDGSGVGCRSSGHGAGGTRSSALAPGAALCGSRRRASSTATCCSSEQRRSRYLVKLDLVANRPKSLACSCPRSCAPASGVSSCGSQRRASSTRAAWPARVNARLRRRRGSPRVGVAELEDSSGVDAGLI